MTGASTPSAHVDVAVLGAGPAGAEAAMAASARGLEVVAIDEQTAAGGQVWRAKSAGVVWAPETPESRAGAALRERLARSTVALRPGRLWRVERVDGFWRLGVQEGVQEGGVTSEIRARAFVVAAGARERVVPTPGWTTPGVLGLAGATALMKGDLTPPGRRVVVAGTGPLLFYVASEVRRLGGVVTAVISANRFVDWMAVGPALAARPDLAARGALWLADLALGGAPIRWGAAVTSIEGGDAVRAVATSRLDGARAERFEADAVCLGHGLEPSVEAAALAGAPLDWREDLGGWVPRADADGRTPVDGLFVCGDGAGIRGAAAAALDGEIVGGAAAAWLGAERAPPHALKRARRRAETFGRAMTRLSRPPEPLHAVATPDTVVCRCEGLTRSEIAAEIAAGAEGALSVKSGTRAGMGPCGGRYCQRAVARMIAAARGVDESAVPPPTARPPLRPIAIAAVAGDFDYDDLPIPKPAPL